MTDPELAGLDRDILPDDNPTLPPGTMRDDFPGFEPAGVPADYPLTTDEPELQVEDGNPPGT